MAAMIQQNPVALRATSPSPQQEQQKSGQRSKDNNNNTNNNSNSSKNDDVAIANYLSSKLRLEQASNFFLFSLVIIKLSRSNQEKARSITKIGNQGYF